MCKYGSIFGRTMCLRCRRFWTVSMLEIATLLNEYIFLKLMLELRKHVQKFSLNFSKNRFSLLIFPIVKIPKKSIPFFPQNFHKIKYNFSPNLKIFFCDIFTLICDVSASQKSYFFIKHRFVH
jgi:hypothetical protein